MKPKHILIRDAIGNLIAEEKSKTNDYSFNWSFSAPEYNAESWKSTKHKCLLP